jgi:hypothetical protein
MELTNTLSTAIYRQGGCGMHVLVANAVRIDPNGAKMGEIANTLLMSKEECARHFTEMKESSFTRSSAFNLADRIARSIRTSDIPLALWLVHQCVQVLEEEGQMLPYVIVTPPLTGIAYELTLEANSACELLTFQKRDELDLGQKEELLKLNHLVKDVWLALLNQLSYQACRL